MDAVTPSGADPVVFAVSHCHPTRIALHAAAFQGGWKVLFMPGLREVLEAAQTQKPRAVFYDHSGSGTEWGDSCSTLAAQGIPFILLGHRTSDETFLVLLARGGYNAWGDPLTSEDIVKAVSLAEEISSRAKGQPTETRRVQ